MGISPDDPNYKIAGWLHDQCFSPEQRLLVGIFIVALKDYLCPEASLAREHRRTAKYYFDALREDEYGSLGHLCIELDVCPNRLRKLALRESTVDIMESTGMIGWNRRRDAKRRRDL